MKNTLIAGSLAGLLILFSFCEKVKAQWPEHVGWTYLIDDEDGDSYSTSDPTLEKNGHMHLWVKHAGYYNSAVMLPALRWKCFHRDYDSAVWQTLRRLDLKATLEGDSIIAAHTIDYSTSLYEFDCDEKRFKVLQSWNYYCDGNITEGKISSSEWTYLVPNSVGMSMAKRACAGK